MRAPNTYNIVNNCESIHHKPMISSSSFDFQKKKKLKGRYNIILSKILLLTVINFEELGPQSYSFYSHTLPHFNPYLHIERHTGIHKLRNKQTMNNLLTCGLNKHVVNSNTCLSSKQGPHCKSCTPIPSVTWNQHTEKHIGMLSLIYEPVPACGETHRHSPHW